MPKKSLSIVLYALLLLCSFSCKEPGNPNSITFDALPKSEADVLKNYIASITFDSLQNFYPTVTVTREDSNTVYVELLYNFPDSIHQDDWRIHIKPAFDATWHWSPHLTPTDNHIVAQHVFRAPALIVTDSLRQLIIVPDLALADRSPVKWYLDLNAPKDVLTLGVSKSKITSHLLFEKDQGNVYPSGQLYWTAEALYNCFKATGKRLPANRTARVG